MACTSSIKTITNCARKTFAPEILGFVDKGPPLLSGEIDCGLTAAAKK